MVTKYPSIKLSSELRTCYGKARGYLTYESPHGEVLGSKVQELEGGDIRFTSRRRPHVGDVPQYLGVVVEGGAVRDRVEHGCAEAPGQGWRCAQIGCYWTQLDSGRRGGLARAVRAVGRAPEPGSE